MVLGLRIDESNCAAQIECTSCMAIAVNIYLRLGHVNSLDFDECYW
jgi:hypothetical protein